VSEWLDAAPEAKERTQSRIIDPAPRPVD